MTESDAPSVGGSTSHPIVLYDGVCGFCNRSVQFILRRDPDGIFRFAPLQSGLAARVLARHGANPSDLDTMYVVVDYDKACANRREEGKSGESLLSRSDAALFVLEQLGSIWRVVAGVMRLLPRSVRDWGYRTIASNRFRMFGRYDTCPLPDEAARARFLDT
jgi:predicted DCC family thiol-disulfide oxidoreductase YuxK